MRLLIVEDEVKLAEALKTGLEHEGYAVDIIHDGQAALNRILLYRNEYDLIILDLMLPNIDGHEICRRIRAEGVTLPILVLTARNETDHKVNVLNSGADDYMVKPFSFSELAARIQALLRRPVTTLPGKLTVKDLELDPTEHVVKRQGQAVPLTLKEFMVLELFMRNPNRILSREEILDHAWDFNFEGFSNIVDVYIKNLRQKLDHEHTHNQSLFETVRGVGYRLKT